MSTAPVTDLGADDQPQLQFPRIESLDELDAHIEKTYGPEVLTALKDSNRDQADIVSDLHKAGLNGKSERIERLYRIHQQEFARKETLLGTTWRWTKNAVSATADVVTWPFRASWGFAKKHPIITSLAVAGAIAGGIYLMWGVPVPIPNPSIAVGEVAAEGADLVAPSLEALPQADIVPPNFSQPYVPEGGPLPSIEPPPLSGGQGDFFSPWGTP